VECTDRFRPPYQALIKVKRADVWQQRDRPRTFDRVRQFALMFGTTAGNAPGNDFAALGDKILQSPGILIVDFQAGIGAEAANFAAMVNAFSATGASRFTR
jgi:hypothetical protein